MRGVAWRWVARGCFLVAASVASCVLLRVLRGCIVVWLSGMRWKAGWEEARGTVVVSCAPRWVGGIVSGSCERGLGYVVGSELGSGGGVVCGVCATLK